MHLLRRTCWLAALATLALGCNEGEPNPVVEMTGGMHATTGGGGGLGSGGVMSGGAPSATGGTSGSGGTGAGGTGGAPATGGSPPVLSNCPDAPEDPAVQQLAANVIGSLGVPFSPNDQDQVGPYDWNSQYGKAPEIIPFASEDALDVFFQDQRSDSLAYVVRIEKSESSYEVVAAYRIQSLGRIMGLTKDPQGNYYVATGVNEEDRVDGSYPPNAVHRENIVRIVKFDENGCVAMESDIDMERGKADPDSEIIVNPMIASTSRLVWGNDRLLLLFGHNTEPDAKMEDVRHQKAISTIIDAETGSVTRTSTMWVSHSFDQRALFDGEAFVEMHLGDAFPRAVALGRYADAQGRGGYSVFSIKGEEGANNTYTRLGSLLASDDPDFGYLALFATERTPAYGGGPDKLVFGTRDVALVRIERDFSTRVPMANIVETGEGIDEQAVTSGGSEKVNHVRWLTELGDGRHAERPRMTRLQSGKIVVLYELHTDADESYQGTYALGLDETGGVEQGPIEVPGGDRLSRGDEVVSFAGQAVYVTAKDVVLHLNFIDQDLVATRVTLN